MIKETRRVAYGSIHNYLVEGFNQDLENYYSLSEKEKEVIRESESILRDLILFLCEKEKKEENK